MTLTRGVALRFAVPGLILAAVLAFLSKATAEALSEGLAGLPKLPVSPVLCAVLIGMLWRNIMGVPPWAQTGLGIAMRGVLRMGIALVGLRLTLAGATTIATTALPVVVGCIGVALVAGMALARAFGISKRLGVFLGTAIHDTSQVIGSALIYSQQMNVPEALAAASVTKLLRNLSIALLIPAAVWWSRGLEQDTVQPTEPMPRAGVLPFFVVAFIAFIITRTVGDSLFLATSQWPALIHAAQTFSELCLICGMAAVGLSVSIPQMWNVGWRPLLTGMLIALLVGACSL